MRIVTVNACTRRGTGGSPTTVVLDAASLSDEQRAQLACEAGTSHTAFVEGGADDAIDVRFFTAGRELAGCGHGTIAAHAALGRSGTRVQRTGGRTLVVDTAVVGEEFEVAFDQGVVGLTPAPLVLRRAVAGALGLRPQDLDDARPAVIASPGAARLLLAVSPSVVMQIVPDLPRLDAITRAAGLLGCFAYAAYESDRRFRARMFAPAIGVGEDIANANSTGCLAALVTARRGQPTSISVDQGDRAGLPSTIVARGRFTPEGAAARLSARATLSTCA